MCAQNFLLIYLVLSLLSAILCFITMISILSFILLFVSFALYIGLVNTDMGPFWYKFVVKFSNTWSGVEWWLCWVAYAASCCRCFSEFKDFKRKHSERWQVTFLSYSLHLNLLLLCPLRNVLSLVPIMALQICWYSKSHPLSKKGVRLSKLNFFSRRYRHLSL